jgi:hypothetical protein
LEGVGGMGQHAFVRVMDQWTHERDDGHIALSWWWSSCVRC